MARKTQKRGGPTFVMFARLSSAGAFVSSVPGDITISYLRSDSTAWSTPAALTSGTLGSLASGEYADASDGVVSFGVPLGAISSGTTALVKLTGTGMDAEICEVPIDAIDREDSDSLGLSALADLLNGGRLDLLIDAIKAQTDDLADGARLDLLIDAILADTNELQTDDVPALIAALNDLSAADVNAQVDVALADYDPPTRAEATADKDEISGLIAALNDISATDILATALTESYAADGAAPTLTQAVLLALQHLSESSITDTTKTVKQLDGSTTAATFTLDDAISPTSITRAT